MKTLTLSALLLALAGSAAAQADDFRRERKDATRAFKDALEGQAPPALDLTGWMNTDGKPLTWDALRGKVVVIDFWGTW